MLTLPDVRQKDDWSCGRALFEALHIYWERPIKPALAALSNPVQGLGPDTLDAALRASGFGVLSGTMTIPLLKSLTGAGYPVGCLIQFEGVGHWTLVGGVYRRRIHYLCPVRGIVSEPVSKWTLNWTDCHLLGGEYRNWGTCPHL
jgi:hypothetical protein